MNGSTVSSARSEEIGIVLAAVVGLSRALAGPRTTPFGETALTRTQLDILFLLAHSTSAVNPGWLADTLQVTPGAITQTVEQLRAAGLVDQAPAEHDARSRVLTLSPPAHAHVRAYEAATVQRAAEWFTALSDDQLGVLARLLSQVRAHR